MENTNSAQPEQFRELLAERVEAHRADLAARYLAVFAESLCFPIGLKYGPVY